MADESVTVKGAPVRSLQKFLEAELTPGQRAAVLDRLPPEFAQRLRYPVLATDTVPVHVLNQLTAEAARIRNEPVEVFGRRAGRHAAEEAVKGVYRFFALVLTPAALLAKGSQMWSTLYNRGQLAVDEQTGNGARIRLLDFPSETAGCSRLTGWIERMAEMTGVTNITVEQTQCFAKGAECCEWRLSWR